MKYVPIKRIQLVREGTLKVQNKCIYGSFESKELFKQYYDELGECREVVSVATLNTKNRVISISQISVGTLDSSLLHPREVFRYALLDGASSIVLAHNHPSGDPNPSSEDFAVTRKIEEIGEIIGIPLLDHIVVGSHAVSVLEARGGSDLARD